MLSSKVTRKGQITIPAELRTRLHIDEGDIVSFRQDGDEIVISNASSIVESLAGSLTHLVKRPMADSETEKAFVAGEVARKYATPEERE